jgi:DNA-binding NarL/FixJ family response regulator
MSVRTTVLIVDDHAVFRAAGRRLFESQGYVVVAEAPDGTSAIDIARELRPDLALVDIYLPDTDGFELASELATLDRPPAVILISSRRSQRARGARAGQRRSRIPDEERVVEGGAGGVRLDEQAGADY